MAQSVQVSRGLEIVSGTQSPMTPVVLTTSERTAWTPSNPTFAFDSNLAVMFFWDGSNWIEL